jgi:hypothetical protein
MRGRPNAERAETFKQIPVKLSSAACLCKIIGSPPQRPLNAAPGPKTTQLRSSLDDKTCPDTLRNCCHPDLPLNAQLAELAQFGGQF